MSVEVRRASARFRTRTDWLDSAHSFSFGPHYDPANTSFGPLLVHNEDVVQPGAGFDDHPHRGVEVVTWVVSGAVRHEDSAGRSAVVRRGTVQVLSAGRGVVHAERNAGDGPLHVVQMWVAADASSEPSYASREVGEALVPGALVPVASGLGHDAVPLACRAALHAGRLGAGRGVPLPEAPRVHVFVVTGEVEVDGVVLGPGDAARLTQAGRVTLSARAVSEVLVWELVS